MVDSILKEDQNPGLLSIMKTFVHSRQHWGQDKFVLGHFSCSTPASPSSLDLNAVDFT